MQENYQWCRRRKNSRDRDGGEAMNTLEEMGKRSTRIKIMRLHVEDLACLAVESQVITKGALESVD